MCIGPIYYTRVCTLEAESFLEMMGQGRGLPNYWKQIEAIAAENSEMLGLRSTIILSLKGFMNSEWTYSAVLT